MNYKTIIKALTAATYEECQRYFEESGALEYLLADDELESDALKNDWVAVARLTRQRDELVEIFPHHKARFDQEYNREVARIAARVDQSLHEPSP